jgi:Copper transport outer membrane protein, MctB
VIDFRYHLVSIIAVFLALAIGIVVGSTALQPAVQDTLSKAEQRVQHQIGSVTKENTTLSHQLKLDQQFAQAGADPLVSHLLTGQSVVLVLAPGADSQVVSGVTGAVQDAGGTVTGQVTLQPQFLNDSESTEGELAQLSQTLAGNTGLTLSPQSSGGPVSGQLAAAQLIAAATVVRSGTGTGTGTLTTTQAQSILAGFAQAGYLQVSPTSSSATTLPPATLAVVVIPATPPGTADSSPANLAVVAVAEALETASSGAVLCGSTAGSGAGSAVDEAQGSGKISTVDYADTTIGQFIVVQALAQLLAGHQPANYGIGPGAVPSPAPTPSVSPATSTSPPARRK